MFKGKVWPALLCIASHYPPSPPPKTSDCKADHSSINQSESVELLKGKSDRKSFQGQTAAEPLANKQETWWRFGKRGDALRRSLGNDAEKVTRTSNSYRKMLISKAKVADSFHKRPLSHCLAFLLKGFPCPTGDFKGRERLQELCLLSPRVILPQLLIVTSGLDCTLWEQGSSPAHP